MKKQLNVGGAELTVSTANQQYFEGTIVVTDPCYFLPEEVWDTLCDQAWFPDGKQTPLADGGTIFYKGAVILYSGTSQGDGSYVVKEAASKTDEFGVDSGTMCVALIEDVKLFQKDTLTPGLYAIVEDFAGDVHFENGNFKGDLTVITDGSDTEEEDEDDWDVTLQDGLDDEDISWDYEKDDDY
jgi:hypothetical protein